MINHKHMLVCVLVQAKKTANRERERLRDRIIKEVKKIRDRGWKWKSQRR